MKKLKKLDIGSGRTTYLDYTTLDKDPAVKPDILADIEEGIPCFDNSIDKLRAHHILEHIRPENKVKVMAEFWRVLKIGGILDIEVPYFPCPASIQDPTHLSFWTIASFWYFRKDNDFGEAFARRYSKYKVPLFEFIEDNKEEIIGKDFFNDYVVYRVKLKKV